MTAPSQVETQRYYDSVLSTMAARCLQQERKEQEGHIGYFHYRNLETIIVF
jgi:hypothetical protein